MLKESGKGLEEGVGGAEAEDEEMDEEDAETSAERDENTDAKVDATSLIDQLNKVDI